MSMLDFIGDIEKADKIYRKPYVPRDKAQNAILSYCPNVRYEDIEILIDETVFGNSKVGVTITSTEIHGKEQFSDPFRYNFSKISSIFIKKGLTTAALNINGAKVIDFTQPSKATLAYLFNRIDLYIQNARIEAEVKPAAHEGLVSPEHADAPESPAAYAMAPESGSPKEPAISAEVSNLEESRAKSIFRRIPKDNLVDAIQKRKYVSSAFNFVGDVLSGNKNSKSEILRREVSGFLAKAILRIRKNYIDRKNVIGLMNDIAALEMAIYSIAFLRIELAGRGVDQRAIQYILSEGLKDFLSLDNSASSRSTLETLLNLGEVAGQTSEEITLSFYIRMVMSNWKGSLANEDMDIELIGSYEYSYEILSPQQAVAKILQDSISEIDDIYNDREIRYAAKCCADILMDL